MGTVHRIENYRPFDVGTPTRCYCCGTGQNVRWIGSECGAVWMCNDCPHPAE